MQTTTRTLLCAALTCALGACGGPLIVDADEDDVDYEAAATIPSAPRELRAAWVATVHNIDWPSRSTLSTAQQQAEALAILDQASAVGLNAIVLQVRPSCDALYASTIEPWSAYLTGASGRAPSPAYDPLTFWVTEAHKRGLLLHAWFNPYRAALPGAAASLHSSHIVKRRPDLVRTVGSYLWLDPTSDEVKRYTMDVIADVVRRYDIDGVHIDDYFYPYRSYLPTGTDFNDDANWSAYKTSGGTLSRADWRRDHVNQLVQKLYERIKAEKRNVLFGIAPFGIWRPGNPAGIVGLDAYAELYADTRLWLNRGWVDYFSPQLYWPISPAAQSYTALVDWWAGENKQGRHLWPGLGTYRIEAASNPFPVSEIVNQIAETRRRSATGNIHYSYRTFARNPGGITTTLRGGLYATRAVVPPSPWLDATLPARPTVSGKAEGSGWALRIEPATGSKPFLYIISIKTSSGWRSDTISASAVPARYVLPSPSGILGLVVRSVDRLGNESTPTWSTPMP